MYAGQLGKHKLLICAVVRFGARRFPPRGSLRQDYSVLTAVERSAPETVATILRHPHVGSWAARCLRRLSRDPGLAAEDLDYLGAIAVSAAILAGYACRVTLRARNGMVMLPGARAGAPPGTAHGYRVGRGQA